MTFTSKMRALCLGLLCVPGLAGCGGGGNDKGPPQPTPTPTPSPLVVSGIVQTNPATAMTGYVVTFDANPKLTAATDASGAFTLSVPRLLVSGTDTLTVTDPSGALVDTLPVAPDAATPNSFNAGTLNVSPPAAPAHNL